MKERVFLSNNQDGIIENYLMMHFLNVTDVLTNKINCSGSTFNLTLFWWVVRDLHGLLPMCRQHWSYGEGFCLDRMLSLYNLNPYHVLCHHHALLSPASSECRRGVGSDHAHHKSGSSTRAAEQTYPEHPGNVSQASRSLPYHTGVYNHQSVWTCHYIIILWSF